MPSTTISDVAIKGGAPLTTPVNSAFSTATTGGTLAAGTYYYRVSALNAAGETLASTETSQITTGSSSTVTVNWGAVTGATGYKIYGRTTGAELLIATVGAVTTYTDTGSVTPSGALPTVNTTANAYIDIGNMSLPAGDWCIGFAISLPNIVAVDYYLLSLGAQSDTILQNNGNLHIGWCGSANNPQRSYCMAAVGLDDSGNQLVPNSNRTFFNGATQYGVMGQSYRSTNSANYEGQFRRSVFIQRKNGAVSVWIVDNNSCAIQFSELSVGSFGAIAAKAARLGCLGKSALSNFSAISYQRFFRLAGTLTQQQMEMFDSGVDPRAIPGLSFSAGNGDLLFAFNVAASDGQTYTDLIQGQTATAHGTFAVATALLPTTVDQNQIRLDMNRYRVHQRDANGTTCSIPLSGTVYGADATIQVALTNAITSGSFDSTVQVAYANLTTSKNGRFSGILTGVPVRLADYRAKFRKGTSGNEYLCDNYFATGIVVQHIGQSLSKQLRTSGSFNLNSGTLTNNARTQSSQVDWIELVQNATGCFSGITVGYAEGRSEQIIGNAAGCCVMNMNDAVSGTASADWIADNIVVSQLPIGMMTNALRNIQRFRPKYIFYHHGNNDALNGVSYATFQANMTTIYNRISAAIAAVPNYGPWDFIIVPVDDNYPSGGIYPAQYATIRSAMLDWARTVGATDSKVSLGYTVNDILKVNMLDFAHKLPNPGGYGIYAEREAQTILNLEGLAANSGLGPNITSAHWNGDATIDVTITHNGGTGLQTPSAGSVTGFEASLTSGFGSTLTISSVAITGANTVRITLSGTPASTPYIRYQYGLPGLDYTTDATIQNALYDNRTPAINTTLGYPVIATSAPLLAA